MSQRRHRAIKISGQSFRTGTGLGNQSYHRNLFSTDGNISVTKGVHGETINISLDDIRNRLNRLYRVADKPTNSLRGQQKEDFQTLVGYTKTLYDTAPYKIYYDEVKSVFGKLSRVYPGTVGAYFAGCIVKPAYKDLKGCSSICAGSMPVAPEDGDTTTCSYPVVFANRKDDGDYNFVKLHNGTNKDMMIVYVDGNHPFRGFSQDEKKKLESMGAAKIDVVRFTDQNSDDEEIYNGFLELDSMPTRSFYTTFTSSSWLWILLILLIVVIIVIGFAWWYRSRKTQTVVTTQQILPAPIFTATSADSTPKTPIAPTVEQ